MKENCTKNDNKVSEKILYPSEKIVLKEIFKPILTIANNNKQSLSWFIKYLTGFETSPVLHANITKIKPKIKYGNLNEKS